MKTVGWWGRKLEDGNYYCATFVILVIRSGGAWQRSWQSCWYFQTNERSFITGSPLSYRTSYWNCNNKKMLELLAWRHFGLVSSSVCLSSFVLRFWQSKIMTSRKFNLKISNIFVWLHHRQYVVFVLIN